ncbi:MAG: hypothetical protein HUJ76_11980, partial [Parasporobacterium sp.]|nr:hypothetical protein [Parasporobacterium sp.]
MYIYHNSHELDYRNPFGAAKVGSEVFLAIDTEDVSQARVRLWIDGQGEALYDMYKTEKGYACSIKMPEKAGLVWYYFICRSYDGRQIYYGNADDALGGVGTVHDWEPVSYQITVYKEAKVPEWYKNSLCYQIFPDRFNRGSDWEERVKDAMRNPSRKGPRRIIHQDWNDTPFYTRNEKQEITRWSFFGGTLEGIREKLTYLKSLGVSCIYLNPVFKAASNHRYDTADYMQIDPMLGDEESFKTLCREAEKVGIGIILDGVFSHTGADSIYF